jgi:hypothetical protein
MAFNIEGNVFTQSDITSDPTQSEVAIYNNGTSAYFTDNGNQSGSFGGSLDFVNGSGAGLSFSPSYFGAGFYFMDGIDSTDRRQLWHRRPRTIVAGLGKRRWVVWSGRRDDPQASQREDCVCRLSLSKSPFFRRDRGDRCSSTRRGLCAFVRWAERLLPRRRGVSG